MMSRGAVTVSTQQKDIFICHASEDKYYIVRPLYERLESEGFDIWYDEAEIKWGDSITERVNWGLIHSKYVLVVLSENFLDKKWPNREFNSVVNRESSSGIVKVLPLLVGGFEAIKKITEAYPLINDKRYLQWSNNNAEIISELYEIFPEKKSFDTSAEKSEGFNAPIDYKELLGKAKISIGSQVVVQLSDASEEGVFVKAESINGLPFHEVAYNLYEKRKGATLLARFLDEAVWSNVPEYKACGFKIFIEIPCLYSEPSFFKEYLGTLITDAGLDSGNVVVMIPEAIIVNNGEEGFRVLQALKEQGMKVGVSQFGTGYSSLSHLKKFGFSYLFTDSSFLRGAESEKSDLVILEAISSIAQQLNIISAVDCVESQGQKELLKSVGCQLMASPKKD